MWGLPLASPFQFRIDKVRLAEKWDGVKCHVFNMGRDGAFCLASTSAIAVVILFQRQQGRDYQTPTGLCREELHASPTLGIKHRYSSIHQIL